MKILITGGSGLLGQYLNIELSRTNQILTLFNSRIGNCYDYNSAKIDLNNFTELTKVFDEFRPQIVIHSAALTSTSLEGNYSLRNYFQTNVIITQKISELCSHLKSKLIYISTDLVYDGNRGSYLKENAKLNPLSPYAESKLVAEEKIKEILDDFVILRLALLIGFGKNQSTNHFQMMFNHLVEKKTIELFIDQFRTPISLSEASRSISKIVSLKIPKGIYNLGGKERISRFELGTILAEIIGADKNLLIPRKLEDALNLANVKDVSMDTSKIQDIGIEICSVEKMIRELMNN
jgi:dTDP-4-dehydrorhamnose reductase